MKDTVRINFDFPREEYAYLKMMCTKKGITIKDYANNAIIEKIESDEDQYLLTEAEKRLSEMDEKDLIPWKEAVKAAGWDV